MVFWFCREGGGDGEMVFCWLVEERVQGCLVGSWPLISIFDGWSWRIYRVKVFLTFKRTVRVETGFESLGVKKED